MWKMWRLWWLINEANVIATVLLPSGFINTRAKLNSVAVLCVIPFSAFYAPLSVFVLLNNTNDSADWPNYWRTKKCLQEQIKTNKLANSFLWVPLSNGPSKSPGIPSRNHGSSQTWKMNNWSDGVSAWPQITFYQRAETALPFGPLDRKSVV